MKAENEKAFRESARETRGRRRLALVLSEKFSTLDYTGRSDTDFDRGRFRTTAICKWGR